MRNGLGVRLHTDTASSHRARSAEGKICCLFTVLLPFLACYLFYFFLGSRAPPPSSAIMSAQIRQLWGLLTMPTLQAVRKLRRSLARHTLLYPPAEPGSVACPSEVVEVFYYTLVRGRPRGTWTVQTYLCVHTTAFRCVWICMYVCTLMHIPSLTLAHHPVVMVRIADPIPHSAHCQRQELAIQKV